MLRWTVLEGFILRLGDHMQHDQVSGGMDRKTWNRDEDDDDVVKSEKGSYGIVGYIGLLGWY